MSKELEKPIKAYLCIVIGMALSALMGQPNSITIAVTAILVMGTGQNTSEQGVCTYIKKRVLLQLVGTILLVVPLQLLRQILELPDWLMVLVAGLLPFAVLLRMDYRLRISPMYITSAAVSGLVLVTGTIKLNTYPLIRIVLVSTGCVLGYGISQWVLPRDHGRDAEKALAAAYQLLTEGVEAGRAGDASRILGTLTRAEAQTQQARTAFAAFKAERGQKKHHDKPKKIAKLNQIMENNTILGELLQVWARHMPEYQQLDETFRASWTALFDRLLDCHADLVQAQQMAAPLEEGELCLPASRAGEVMFAGCLRYYGLCVSTGERERSREACSMN